MSNEENPPEDNAPLTDGENHDETPEENPVKELWREAWDWRKSQEKERRADRIEDLKSMRKDLHDNARAIDDALAELEGKGDWTQLMKPLKNFGWLHSEPPPRLALLEYNQDCVLPLGKVGFFVGEGGIGKSWALTQLAISVCTGSSWLQTYRVPEYAMGGVVMAMGEEDPHEMHRRIHNIVSTLDLAEHHLSMLESRLFPLPLSGFFMEFLEDGERSFEHERFEQLLIKHAPEQGWKLIVLDPASRFMGVDAEKDNAYATRFVQLLERLTQLPGNPTVLCAHHTTKAARTSSVGARSVAARGASALTDGARWQGNLFTPVDEASDEFQDHLAVFQITKSNYGPKPPGLYLKRKEGSGVLVPFHDTGASDNYQTVTGHTGNFDQDQHFFSKEDTRDFASKSSRQTTHIKPSWTDDIDW